MSKYKGLFTFDVDNHRYLPVEQADGIIDCMNYYPESEPLIKDKRVRKVVRAWAEVNGAKELKYIVDENSLQDIFRNSISFNRVLDLKDGYTYTIAELCGEEEAPEPIEPTFIDLDERVKEKEEE